MSDKCRPFKILGRGIDNVELGPELLIKAQIVLDWVTKVQDGDFLALWYSRGSSLGVKKPVCGEWSESRGSNVRWGR